LKILKNKIKNIPSKETLKAVVKKENWKRKKLYSKKIKWKKLIRILSQRLIRKRTKHFRDFLIFKRIEYKHLSFLK